jgi:hypothetical protein
VPRNLEYVLLGSELHVFEFLKSKQQIKTIKHKFGGLRGQTIKNTFV